MFSPHFRANAACNVPCKPITIPLFRPLHELGTGMPFDTNQSAYHDLRNIVAEHTNRLILWVGAGLSRPAGLPSWAELRKGLEEELRRKSNTLDDEGQSRLLEKLSIAQREKDPWVAIQILRNNLGDTSYAATIRSSIAPAINAIIPPLYEQLWTLRPGGILTLNLDRFAARSYPANSNRGRLTEFVGCRAGSYVHLLQLSNPFVGNLHGVDEDTNSWVLSSDDLNNLMGNHGYLGFLNACLASRIVLLLGITAEDIATGGHLRRLKTQGVALGSHFWLTDRRDYETDAWAESVGIRIIRYANTIGDHSELNEIFSDLLSFMPVDDTAPPIVPTVSTVVTTNIPSPTEIIKLPAEDIRNLLNSKAGTILAPRTPAALKEYENFCKKYEEAMYRAWFISDVPPNNVLFGTTVVGKAGRGAFGRVYEAMLSTGERLAVKVLHQEVRTNQGMLHSFRRGVNSMRILSSSHVDGMVPYKAAYEIPACVFMDFVDGPSIADAVHSNIINNWESIVRIALDLSMIIRDAHLLPERVLHRDIRPANIMLKDYYAAHGNWQVVVLDFDLSWHRDALGVTIDNATSTSGYLAPEQVHRGGRYSSRSALVDSFGIGMTCYYLLARRDPVFSQHKHQDWRVILTSLVNEHSCTAWHSLPRRFARLIEWATKDKQPERWDMAQIVGELSMMKQALTDSSKIVAAEFLAEELAERSKLGGHYRWNRDGNEASYSFPNGVVVRIQGDETNQEVIILFQWISHGLGERKKIGKWIPKACDQAVAALKRAHCKVQVISKSANEASVRAARPCNYLASHISEVAEGISAAIDAFDLK